MARVSSYKIGVDIGGTFTDVTVVETDGTVTSHKTPSTPRAPAEAVLRGLFEVLDRAQLDPAQCMRFVHGSTIGVNTIIQRTGARVGVVLTKGFEDLLELGRTKMPDPFSLFTMRPVPLARKDMVRGVVERIDAKGRVVAPLDEASLVAAANDLVRHGAEVLAVIFVNAYRNPVHEQRARSRLRAALPEVDLIVSTDVWPQVREYERATVTVINSYIAPKMEQYLGELRAKQGSIGLHCPLYITSSNGGIVPITDAITRPIQTLLSGPAAGVVATLQLMHASKLDRVVTMDIGGTSADLCVLDGDHVPYAWDQEIDGLPVTLPSVDVSSIGAGGGSIAYSDNMGLLRVGPQSAGADPGPVAYGRGGAKPTLTDAYLLAGFIDAQNFLGGRLPLDIERARGAIKELGRQLNLGVEDAASGVIQVATSNLAAEFTRLAAKKGIDPREFTLVPFGGAGATHACLLADDVHIRTIAIPYSPGTLCATGSVLADFRLDFVQSVYSPLERMDQGEVDVWIRDIEARANETLKQAAEQIERIYTIRTADVRYAGQGYEVTVTYDRINELPERFRREYTRLYGPRIDEAPLEVINIRATVIGVSKKATPGWGGGAGSREPRGSRRIQFADHYHDCPVYVRTDMAPGWSAVGPFIVDQPDTTCVVTPGWRGSVDTIGTLHLSREV